MDTGLAAMREAGADGRDPVEETGIMVRIGDGEFEVKSERKSDGRGDGKRHRL